MKRYPAYKDSGFLSTGKIPKHWEIRRLKFAAQVNPPKSEIRNRPDDTEVSFLPMELVGNGTLRLDQTKLLGEVEGGYTYFRETDIVIAKITPCFENGKGAIANGLRNGIGFGTTELHVIRASKRALASFLYYLTLSYPFRGAGIALMQGTAGQKRVPDDFVVNFPTPLPTIDEQRTIVAFLDRKLEEIDRYIANKERQIELLEEQKTALINQVVTQGLNPTTPIKTSGIEDIDRIPTHWEIRRAKYYFSDIDERSEAGQEELLSVSHITGVTPRRQKEITMFLAESYYYNEISYYYETLRCLRNAIRR